MKAKSESSFLRKERIAFIGLGTMGKAMAKNILKKGYSLTVCGHRNMGPIEELRSLGAMVANTPGEAAESSDVIIIMVRDVSQTDDVFFGNGSWNGSGVLNGLNSGSTVMLCSTLQPYYCRNLAEKGREKGAFVLDSPVSGGSHMAEEGTLTFMVGGSREAFNRCMAIYETMGKIIFYLGDSGMGQVIKLVNNYMMVVTSHGTTEAIRMGLKAGLGLEQMMEIIKVSSGNSSVIGHWNVLADEWKERMDNDPGMVSLFHKDMVLAVDLAEKLGAKADFGKLVIKSNDSYLFPTRLGE